MCPLLASLRPLVSQGGEPKKFGDYCIRIIKFLIPMRSTLAVLTVCWLRTAVCSRCSTHWWLCARPNGISLEPTTKHVDARARGVCGAHPLLTAPAPARPLLLVHAAETGGSSIRAWAQHWRIALRPSNMTHCRSTLVIEDKPHERYGSRSSEHCPEPGYT